MKMIFLSPHLDDAAYSCGGIIWDLCRRGEDVETWTIFSGVPRTVPLTPFALSLHERWRVSENTLRVREEEDATACQRLGCKPVHLGYLDCIYRRLPTSNAPVINTGTDLFTPIQQEEYPLVDEIAERLAGELDDCTGLAVPLTVGGHVDHRITRAAAERLGRRLWYYADYPYSAVFAESVNSLLPENATEVIFELSGEGLNAWQSAIAAYASQWSSFWVSLEVMREHVEMYSKSPAAGRLWKNWSKEQA